MAQLLVIWQQNKEMKEIIKKSNKVRIPIK